MTKKAIGELVRKTYTENSNDPEKQIRELKKLLKQAQGSGDRYFLGLVFHMLAAAYNMAGDRENMFLNSVKSLAVLKNTDDHKMIADAYITLGAAYFNQENYQLALANYDKAYEIIRKHRIKGLSRLIVMNNLATVYNVMEDYRSGIRYLTECLELAKHESQDDMSEQLVFSINLADSYMHVGDIGTAVKIFSEAEDWVGKVAVRPYVCYFYTKSALAYYRLPDKRKASKRLDKAFELAGEAQDAYFIYDDFKDLLHILVRNGDRIRADKVAGLIREFGGRNEHTMDKLLVCSSLADYHRSIGERDRALEYYEQVEEYYKTRIDELKQVQLSIHKSLKEADASISRLGRMIAESEDRASRDPMTKLLNRSAILRVGSEFISSAAKKNEKVGAIFIDIDFFKECNDTYGHARGDEIIKEVADMCRMEESENIRFSRYGGDEFLGLCRGFEDDEVADIARRICERLRKAAIPNKKNPHGGRVTISVGIVNVAVTEKTDTIVQIANYADKAVYYSKNAGKNCIHLLDHDHKNKKGKAEPFVRIESRRKR